MCFTRKSIACTTRRLFSCTRQRSSSCTRNKFSKADPPSDLLHTLRQIVNTIEDCHDSRPHEHCHDSRLLRATTTTETQEATTHDHIGDYTQINSPGCRPISAVSMHRQLHSTPLLQSTNVVGHLYWLWTIVSANTTKTKHCCEVMPAIYYIVHLIYYTIYAQLHLIQVSHTSIPYHISYLIQVWHPLFKRIPGKS